jgi:predicted transcriptional regulator
MPTTPYSVRLDDDVREALEAEAQLEDRPAAQLAARAIKDMLRAKAARRGAIDAALTEADAGSFVSSEAMGAWVESWGSGDELPAPVADIEKT